MRKPANEKGADHTELVPTYARWTGMRPAFVREATAWVLCSYAIGEMDFKSTVEAIDRVMRACDPKNRDAIVSFVVERAIQIASPRLRRRRPEFPGWVKAWAVVTVRRLQAQYPRQRLAPDEHTEWTSPILRAASDWLVTLGVCDANRPIPQHTLYRWYCASEKHKKRTLARR